MANFNTSYYRTAQHEGGYQANPNDTGNYNSLGELVGTNHGINAQVYENWLGYPPTQQQMANMPQSTAKLIFQTRFWSKMMGDQISSQPLADIIYDGIVNHGKGVELLQQVLGIVDDNIFGATTLTAVQAADPGQLYVDYKERRRKYYIWLANWRPANQVFLQGWLNRLNTYNDFPNYQPSTDGFSLTKVAAVGIAVSLILFS